MRKVFARIWQYEFCWRLRRAAGVDIRMYDLQRAMARLPHVPMPGSDAAVYSNRIMAQTLHAAGNLLEDFGFDRAQSLAILTEAFVGCGGWLVRHDVRMWMLIDKHPFLIVTARGPAKLVERCHGNGMQVSQDCGADAVTLRVERCPFHEYFWNASRPELTQVMRAWDANWMDVINASKRPIQVSSWLVDGSDGHYVIHFRNLAKQPKRRHRLSPGIC